MARIDLMFYSNGMGNVALGSNLEEDLREDKAAGGDDDIIAHVSFEESDEDFRSAVVDSLWATHVIECAGSAGEAGYTVFEKFVSEIFKAGMEYGRKSPLIRKE